MKRYLISVLILAVFLAAGFTIPSMLLEWKDEQRLETAEIEDSEGVVLTMQTNMTIVEKLQLMSSSMVDSVEMSEGKNFTAEEIIVNAQKELKTLSELGIIEFGSSTLTYGIDTITFLIDILGGNQSMLLWVIHADTGYGRIYMQIDDETGKILTLTYINESTSAISTEGKSGDWEKEALVYEGDLETAAGKWAEYLGIELIETSVYDKTIVSGLDEMQKEIEILVEKGMDRTEAENKIYEEWGVGYVEADEFSERRLYATYEDAGGIVMLGLRKNTAELIFNVELYD